MSEFIGQFHVAIIHLPIGILLIALLLLFLRKKEKFHISQQVIKIVLLAGVVFALLSCFTGYILSTTGFYEKPLVVWHMWMGICLAMASMVLYMKVARYEFDVVYKLLAVGLLVLIIVTGHLGASLTHGSDYISFDLDSDDTGAIKIQPLVDVQQANVYDSVIRPILQARCYSCHSSKEIKGGLRLDSYKWMMKGGKDGKIITPGDAAKSDMIKMILLPEENKKHMPPKKKMQLTHQQIALLQWWIDNGADTIKIVNEMPQPEPVKTYLLKLQVWSKNQSQNDSLNIIKPVNTKISKQ